MRDLIRSLKFTKESSLEFISETLLRVPDFSSNYYLIKGLGCYSYDEAALKVYDYLQSDGPLHIN